MFTATDVGNLCQKKESIVFQKLIPVEDGGGGGGGSDIILSLVNILVSDYSCVKWQNEQ